MSTNDTVRVIVEVRVPEGDMSAGFDLARGFGVESFDLDSEYDPVPMDSPSGVAADVERAGQEVVAVRGIVDEGDVERLEAEQDVVAVWTDAEIRPFAVQQPQQPSVEAEYEGLGLELLDSLPIERAESEFATSVASEATGACPVDACDCSPRTAKGDLADVARYLGVDDIWQAGYRGRGMVVGVVDGGISAEGRVSGGKIPRVTGGWPEDDWGTRAGWGQHGNMVSTDVLGMAPETELYDLRISDASGVSGTISDALASYQWAVDRHRRNGTPDVLTNSWGMYRKSWAPDYATNIDHVFTRKVAEAINQGILVLFAAGNCGGACPSDRCGSDTGPGKSIWGANGHPQVLTVGAANKNETFVGYSSQGPAALDPQKPDTLGISHFTGYFPSDTGTSAATPIVAGVAALLRQRNGSLSPEEVKGLLKRTSKDIGESGWDKHTGSGIVQAKTAFDAIDVSTKVRPWDLRVTGTQFHGDIDPGQTQRWFTFNWPSEYSVDWNVRPTSPKGQVDWSVDIERGQNGNLTYWLTIRNVGEKRTGFEARYSIVR